MNSIGSQEKWRQKQLSVLYKEGRPIFGICNEKNEIRRIYPASYWIAYQKRSFIRTYPNLMRSSIILD